jgi:hypothetical protein
MEILRTGLLPGFETISNRSTAADAGEILEAGPPVLSPEHRNSACLDRTMMVGIPSETCNSLI